jgi:TrmH family RNA methyltransferase
LDSFSFLSSTQNPKIRLASSLREAKARKQQGLFLVDGCDLTERALLGGLELSQIFFKDKAESIAELEGLRKKYAFGLASCECYRVSPDAMQKLQYGERDLGMIAVAKVPETQLGSFAIRVRASVASRSSGEPVNQCYLVLDRMEKPGNLGAALRTADGAGVSGVILADPICDVWNPNAVRASLGALFTVPIAVSSVAEIHAYLYQAGIQIFTARVEGAVPYTSADFRRPHAIVIGNEANGLQHRWQTPDVQAIAIPMSGVVDSLNASVSTAILLYESKRQNPVNS